MKKDYKIKKTEKDFEPIKLLHTFKVIILIDLSKFILN